MRGPSGRCRIAVTAAAECRDQLTFDWRSSPVSPAAPALMLWRSRPRARMAGDVRSTLNPVGAVETHRRPTTGMSRRSCAAWSTLLGSQVMAVLLAESTVRDAALGPGAYPAPSAVVGRDEAVVDCRSRRRCRAGRSHAVQRRRCWLKCAPENQRNLAAGRYRPRSRSTASGTGRPQPDRQQLAGSVSSLASPRAVLGPPVPRIESQLPGGAAYSHCRPLPVARRWRKSRRQRPVPRYSRRRSVTERSDKISEAVVRALRCRQAWRADPVSAVQDRTGAAFRDWTATRGAICRVTRAGSVANGRRG